MIGFRNATIAVAILAAAAGLAASGVVATGAAQAQSKKAAKPTALVPFEAERAKERGDRNLIRLNDDITRMSASRVVELPVVDGRMGDHARLEDVEIFFPFGSIVLATAEFHKYRPALVASAAVTPVPDVSADPRYDRVKSFDHQLGKVCASEKLNEHHRVEMRISPERVLSLVHITPAKHQGPTASDNPSYKVVSALEMRFLSFKEPDAERLYRQCQRPAGTKLSQKD
ncbi:MAG: hypothetical protein ACK4FK_07925 [Ferrovibrio sp.]|jgi:hypothetical protein|uniref:hypothetical protein n=1 Tax=Ferrovibrio sp. TaxID=1917215 RepID=UPI00391BB47E